MMTRERLDQIRERWVPREMVVSQSSQMMIHELINHAESTLNVVCTCGWIKVSERLPDHHGDVHTWNHNWDHIKTIHFDRTSKRFVSWHDAVTHWRELPSPPPK